MPHPEPTIGASAEFDHRASRDRMWTRHEDALAHALADEPDLAPDERRLRTAVDTDRAAALRAL